MTQTKKKSRLRTYRVFSFFDKKLNITAVAFNKCCKQFKFLMYSTYAHLFLSYHDREDKDRVTQDTNFMTQKKTGKGH